MRRSFFVFGVARCHHVTMVVGAIAASGLHAPTAQAAPSRDWGSYYGGSAVDAAYDVALDSGGNAVIVGVTASTSGIHSSGAHDTAYSGSNDGFVGQFDTTGNLAWGTYYGADQHDVFRGVALDTDDNVYAVGWTYSSTDIATAGAHDTTWGGNVSSDIMLVKFDANGVRQWGTYLGGDQHDDGYGVCVGPVEADGEQSVYVVGWVRSASDVASVGAFDTSLNGYDAVLAKFSSSGTRRWSTYYGGTEEEYGLSCAVDSLHNVYLAGRTKSSTDIAFGGHDTSYGGSAKWDGFLVKFNSAGSPQWGTYYGGSEDDEVLGVDVDSSNNVYIAGRTRSSNGSLATLGAYDTSLTDAEDGFVAKFSAAGVRQWGTYFGGSNADATASQEAFTGIDVAGSSVYLGGYTDSTAGIASAGAWDTTQAGTEAMFVVMSTALGIVSGASYNGGSGEDRANGVAADAFGKAALAGKTNSNSAIGTLSVYDPLWNLSDDAFVTVIDP